MARDYKSRRKRSGGFSGWLGVVCGLAVGLAVAGAVYLKDRREKDVKPDIRGVPETRRGTYVLQAGSYKNFADADRVRAQLALQGVESKVQKVSVDNDTWHRIRIGPISQLDELNRLRTILRKADVDVLVIRVGD